MLLVSFPLLRAESIYIDINSNNPNQTGAIEAPFHSITGALEHVYDGNLPQDNIASFRIMSGNYEESISIQNTLDTSGIQLWEFLAHNGEVKIIGDSGSNAVNINNMMGASISFQQLSFTATHAAMEEGIAAVYANAPNLIDELRFIDCSFSGFREGILIVEPTEDIGGITINIWNLVVQDCNFEGILNDGYGIYTFARNDEIFGEDEVFVRNIAIHGNKFSDSGIDPPEEGYTYDCITIRNWRKAAPAYKSVHIYENIFTSENLNVKPYGITLDRLNRQPTWQTQIACKAFVYDNEFLNHQVRAEISKLKFTHNNAEITDASRPPFLTFKFLDYEDEVHADTLWTQSNIIRAPKVYALSVHAILDDFQNSYFGDGLFMDADDSSATILNSLISGYNEYFDLDGFSSVHTSHSYYDTLEPNDHVSYVNCLSTVDPLISYHNTGLGYSLLWDNDNRSPLIMAGYEAISSSYRSHRPDIGAVQYDEYPHEYITYTFPSYSQRNGLKWMSFPSLDRIWNPATGEPDLALTFFDPILDVSILDQIAWKVLDNHEEFIYYEWPSWHGADSHSIIPQQGYKIQMAQGLQDPQSISVPGIIPQVDQYPLSIVAQTASKAIESGNQNWLGYFHEATVNGYNAFASIIDNLWSIQTQNWTMVREKAVPGSPWIIALQYGKNPTLSYGDMVIVKCFADAQFYWNTAAITQIPLEKELPTHFEYAEKADYIPFYVEMGTGDLPSEIALYVNDVCSGAAVVCDSLVEIPGYIVDDPDPDAVVEIRAYYESKAAVDQVPEFRVWNPASGIYECKPLILNSKNYYYKLKLSQSGEDSPMVSKRGLEVYPNPFNPSTTIRFSLPEAAEIRLDIYNLKGQLVRNLAKGDVMAGKHSIVWDGADNHHQRVASGLYYSKLSYENKSYVKKMIMLK